MTSASLFPVRALMEAPEVAAVLGISRNHVYHLAKTGVLPVIRLGRRMKFPTVAIQRMVHVETEKPASAPTETGFI